MWNGPFLPSLVFHTLGYVVQATITRANMKDITVTAPDAHARKLNTSVISSWLRGVKFLKKKKSKYDVPAKEEPVYDVDDIRRSEYPLLDGS